MNLVLTQKIRQLQRDEGNGPCFKTGQSYCKWQQECCWSELCLEEFKIKAIHNHKTGKIRDLLCHKCNHAIGYFDEDVTRIMNAITYLKRHENE